MVYVLGQDGHPLMPTCRHGKVKRMLKSRMAKVVKKCPFTIQLQYESTTHTQKINLGIDAGSKTILVDISHILGNLITVIFDYQILRKPLKILSL